MALLEPGEAAASYKARILSYQTGANFLSLQAAAPEKLASLPPSARRPGAGVKVGLLDPHKLARKIVDYCERRKPELVVPGRARIVFAVSQLWPGLGDWIVRKMS